MDFLFDWSEAKRQLKVFTLVDRFTPKAWRCALDTRFVPRPWLRFSIAGACAAAVPGRFASIHGPEFISATLSKWCVKPKRGIAVY
jgi:hypothetical protein